MQNVAFFPAVDGISRVPGYPAGLAFQQLWSIVACFHLLLCARKMLALDKDENEIAEAGGRAAGCQDGRMVGGMKAGCECCLA